MKIQLQTKPILELKTDLIAVGVFEEQKSLSDVLDLLNKKLKGVIHELLKGSFKGKEGESFSLYTANTLFARHLLFVGLGKKEKYHLNRARGAVGTIIRSAKRLQVKQAVISLQTLDRKSVV